MISGILALFKVANEVWAVIKQAVLLYNQAKREGWIEEGKDIAKKIREAKSDAERKELVKRLADHDSGIPS
jgi:hypothetical protein